MKKFTHVFAVVFAGAIAFAATPAGQALVHQYPHFREHVRLFVVNFPQIAH